MNKYTARLYGIETLPGRTYDCRCIYPKESESKMEIKIEETWIVEPVKHFGNAAASVITPRGRAACVTSESEMDLAWPDEVKAAIRKALNPWRVEKQESGGVLVQWGKVSKCCDYIDDLPGGMPEDARAAAIGMLRFNWSTARDLLAEGYKMRREGWKPGALCIQANSPFFLELSSLSHGATKWTPFFKDFSAEDWQIVQ